MAATPQAPAGGAGAGAAMPDPIPACPADCPAPDAAESKYRWCSYPVQPPHTPWEALDERIGGSRDADKRCYAALQGVDVYLVQSAEEVGPALAALYDSMRDPLIGIDTEWRPDSRACVNDVALVQLSSSSVVVLLRTCCLGELPQAVVDFCRDDAVVGVGFDWGASDERKMLESFGLDAGSLFSTFLDVRAQAELMGYCDHNLGSLARRLLRFQPPASKEVTVSNWEAAHLSPRQLRYAALDALLTGDLLRALRRLHAAPAPCRGCALPLGAWPGRLELRCRHPDCERKKAFASVAALAGHARSKGHADTTVASCGECGRWSASDGIVRLAADIGRLSLGEGQAAAPGPEGVAPRAGGGSAAGDGEGRTRSRGESAGWEHAMHAAYNSYC